MKKILPLFVFLILSCSQDNNREKPLPQTSGVTPVAESRKTTSQPAPFESKPVDQTDQHLALNKDIAELAVGKRISLPVGSGKQYDFQISTKVSTKQGITTLRGNLEGDDRYHMTITASKAGTFGRLQTPETTYQITVEDGKALVVDLYAPGNIVVPRSKDDMAIPPRQEKELVDPQVQPETIDNTREAAAVLPQAAGITTIDIMILYTPGLTSRYPGELLETRLEYLVEVANSAYINSNINTALRLVHSEQVSYPEDTTNNAALDAITDHTSPFNQLEELRTLHGADLVVLMRPYDYYNHGGCGLAWVLGYNGNFTGQEDGGYSVVGDGRFYVGDSYVYCTDLTMTHEIGHNLGSAHDRANSDVTPAYPYAYGYGFEGLFGTVMSYTRPEVDVFSNPALTCGPNNDPCGVNENDQNNSAHNTLALNNSSAAIAAFKVAHYNGDLNNDGQTDLSDAIQALRLSIGETPAETLNIHEDINGDGKIGIEEAIYGLQQQQ